MSVKENIDLLNSLNTMTQSELQLNDIFESAKKTLQEAFMFFHLVKINLANFDISNEEDAYALNNVLATNLSMSCELSLKALYLYEQKNSGKRVEELWADLRNPKRINPNLANRTSGHSLDILLSHLSNDVRALINHRVRMLDKNLVEQYPEITFIDILSSKGIVSCMPFMSSIEYDNDLSSHKETFVSSRYGGQAYSKPDIKFLYHMAMQITTIARFFILPTRKVTYNLDFGSYANKVPVELIMLYQAKPEYVTDDLINLFLKKGEQKASTLKTLMEKYSGYLFSYQLEPMNFYYLISAFDANEINNVFESVSYLETEGNNDIISFLNFCIMTHVIFKEKIEDGSVKFKFVDYVALNKIYKMDKSKIMLFSEPYTIVEYQYGDYYYENEKVGAKKI